jgi:hypothetical protein
MESTKYEKITFSILSRSSNSKRSKRLSSNMVETLGVGIVKLSTLRGRMWTDEEKIQIAPSKIA